MATAAVMSSNERRVVDDAKIGRGGEPEVLMLLRRITTKTGGSTATDAGMLPSPLIEDGNNYSTQECTHQDGQHLVCRRGMWSRRTRRCLPMRKWPSSERWQRSTRQA